MTKNASEPIEVLLVRRHDDVLDSLRDRAVVENLLPRKERSVVDGRKPNGQREVRRAVTKVQRPPTLNSKSSTAFVKPSSPHHAASISGEANASYTARGANGTVLDVQNALSSCIVGLA